MELIKVILLVICCTNNAFGYDPKGFDDTVLYKIDWPGNLDMKFDEEKFEPMIVATPDQEKYKCMIPHTNSKEENDRSIDTNLSPLHYLSPIFSSSSCSYRIESYWAYEICHGHHIKQYHEDREGKNVKVQEYFLGKWSSEKMEKLKKKLKEDQDSGRKFKTLKIDNIHYPYLEMEMGDGTLCDLNGEPRTTKLRYVCYPHAKSDIYSLKETSSCNYEVVVLTSVLCMHPAFIPEDTDENVINCIPVDNAPKKPRSWLLNEIDHLKQRYKQVSEILSRKDNAVLIKINPKDGSVRMELIQSDLFEKALNLDSSETKTDKEPSTLSSSEDATTTKETQDSTDVMSSSTLTSEKYTNLPRLATTPKDTTPVKEFLQGKNCLTGGSGWWKFEFCYGRFVRQYHVNKNSNTEYIYLGYFDANLHKIWLKSNPDKRPKPKSSRTEIIHYYQGGNICDKTEEKRQTEVKLKCLTNTSSTAAVSLYLLEPKTCQYVLVVESPLICDIIKLADDNGLISNNDDGGDDDDDDDSATVDEDSDAATSKDTSPRDGKPVSVYIGNVPIENFEVRYEND